MYTLFFFLLYCEIIPFPSHFQILKKNTFNKERIKNQYT